MTIEKLIAEYANIQREKFALGFIAGTNAEAAVSYACSDLLNMVRHMSVENRLAVIADEVAFARECLDRRKAA